MSEVVIHERMSIREGTLLFHGTPYAGIRMLEPASWLAFDADTAWRWADPKEWVEYSEPVRARVLVFEVKKTIDVPVVDDEFLESFRSRHTAAEYACADGEAGWAHVPDYKPHQEVMLCDPEKWLRYKRTLTSQK